MVGLVAKKDADCVELHVVGEFRFRKIPLLSFDHGNLVNKMYLQPLPILISLAELPSGVAFRSIPYNLEITRKMIGLDPLDNF